MHKKIAHFGGEQKTHLLITGKIMHIFFSHVECTIACNIENSSTNLLSDEYDASTLDGATEHSAPPKQENGQFKAKLYLKSIFTRLFPMYH